MFRKDLDKVLSGLTKVVEELEVVISQSFTESAQALKEVEEAKARHEHYNEVGKKAARVKGNIAKLLE